MNIHECIDKWHSEDGVQFFWSMDVLGDSVCLDFGCGYGEYSIAFALANPGSKIYAIDKNRRMLKFVREKIEKYGVANIVLQHADGSLKMDFPNNFADIILMYDLIHGNTQDKMPIRFALFEEAKRVLKPGGILSIAPFECGNLRDRNGKSRKYTHPKMIAEIEASGFQFNGSVDGAVHFDYYHSAYHWKKLNGDMPFDYLEKGPVLNFSNIKD